MSAIAIILRILRIAAIAAAVAAAHVLLKNAPASPSVAGVPAVVRALMALAVLALGVRIFCGGGGREDAARAVPRRPRGWLDHAAAAATVLAAHFGFLWLLGAAPPAIERAGLALEPWLRPEAAARRDTAERENDGPQAGNWLWQDQRERPLPRRTNLRPGNRPEIFLRIDSPADAAALLARQVHVHAFSLSRHRGGAWTTQDAAPSEVATRPGDGWSVLPSPNGRATARPIRHEVFHAANAAGQNVLTALQGVESAGIAPLRRIDDGFLLLPAATDADGFQYPAVSRPLSLHDLADDRLLTPPPAGVAPELLETADQPRVAARLDEVVASLSADGATAGSLKAVEAWLRGAFDYSLETTNPRDLDPLENFLFEEQRGHCEHFATVGALMARALGVPARVAYGWAGGTWYDSSRLMVFRAREAHAWTEVLVPGAGWVVMDPTPPPGIDGTRARIAPPDELPPDPAAIADLGAGAGKLARIDHAALLLLAIFAIPALGLLIFLTMRRPPSALDATWPNPAGSSAAPGYLDAWREACPPDHPGVTLRQQLHRIEPAPPFADGLLNYHYRTRYTGAKPDAAAERRLAREIRRWSRSRPPQGLRE